MRLNYYVLWVEDDDSWYDTTAELFSETIVDNGFHPIINRKKNLDGVTEEILESGLKKFDIFLIDFKLRNSKDGDSIIDYVRANNIYTDIIFYSSDKQSIVDSIKEHLFEGVYHSDRNELEDKFEKVFKTTIKKVEEINSMRGLIVGETSELDSIIEEHLLYYIQSQFIEKFDLNNFIDKEILCNLDNRKTKIIELYSNSGIHAILPYIDAIKKVKLLRGILKSNKDHKNFIPEFIDINSSYQNEVIEIRNKFAHSMVIINESGIEVLKALVGNEHFVFDENSFKTIRENLLKHRDALLKLRD